MCTCISDNSKKVKRFDSVPDPMAVLMVGVNSWRIIFRKYIRGVTEPNGVVDTALCPFVPLILSWVLIPQFDHEMKG